MSVEALRAIRALDDWSDQELALFYQGSTMRAFKPRETIVQQGEVGESCFLIMIGNADVVKTARDRIRIVGSLGPGAIVGQIALIDRAPRSASVIATGELHALELRRAVFDRYVESFTPIALKFQERIARSAIRQLRAATDRLGALMHQRSTETNMMSMQAALDDWDLDDREQPAIDLATAPRIRRL